MAQELVDACEVTWERLLENVATGPVPQPKPEPKPTVYPPPPPPPLPTPKERSAVRIQLQSIFDTQSILLGGQDKSVTTQEVIAALTTLYNSVPKRLQSNATPAYNKAVKWTQGRPPAGVGPGTSKSFYFEPYIDDWRFDIEILIGYHLMQ